MLCKSLMYGGRKGLMRICAAVCLVSAGALTAAQVDDFDADLKELKKVDPSMVGYRQSRTVPVEIRKPSAMAVGHDGRIYAAGSGSLRIWEKGMETSSVKDIEGEAVAMAVDGDGVIYMGFKDHIEVYSPDGSRTEWAELGEQSHITSVAVSGDNVFIADAGQRVLWKYSRQGRMLERAGGRDSIAGRKGFIVPSPNFDLAAGHDGSLWIVNPGMHTLIHLGTDGKVVDSWRKAGQAIDGFCGCCNPCHIAVLPDGSLVTGEKGLMRVKVVSAKGELVTVVAGPDLFERDDAMAALGTGATPGMSEAVADIAVLDGQVLVLDRNAGLIRIFEKKAEE